MIPRGINEKFHDAIALWVGEENIRWVNKADLLDRFAFGANLWQGVFSKLWAHNMTEFDKIIVLDADILIRTNIMHWFDYSTPCAVQTGMEWNSGAIVIKPDAEEFQDMWNELPKLKRYNDQMTYDSDPLTGGHGQQAFLTSFFLREHKKKGENPTAKRCVMPIEASVPSSALRGESFSYFNKFHPEVYETVHLTLDKPWRGGAKPDHPFICSLLREWNETMVGLNEYRDLVPPIRNNFLEKC